MDFRYIGRSGLRVSSICMGTMTFGSSASKQEAFKILDKAYDSFPIVFTAYSEYENNYKVHKINEHSRSEL